MPATSHPARTGVGLGLRGAFLADIAGGAADGRVAFVEVAPENYMRRGGRAPHRLAQVCERFDVLSHGLMLSLGGRDPFDPEYFATLAAFLKQHRAPWHSDHLCWSGHEGTALHDLFPVPFTTASARNVAARVCSARDRLDCPMAVENISYYLRLGEDPLDEARFVAEVLDRADCGLLLDVNNVFVNAQNHGFDPSAWLAEIPLERVWQIHVAGHERWDDDLVIDTHGAPVCDPVYELLEAVIERIGPTPVVLERDSNIGALAELLTEVERIDTVYQRALARFERRAGATSHAR